MRPSAVAAITIASLALGAGACGEDHKKLSKAELVRKADAVCVKYRKTLTAIAQPGAIHATQADFARLADYFDKVVPLTEDLHGELSDLKPEDDGVATMWDVYLDQTQAGIDDVEAVGKKARDGDKAAVQAGLRDQDGPDARPIFGDGDCGE